MGEQGSGRHSSLVDLDGSLGDLWASVLDSALLLAEGYGKALRAKAVGCDSPVGSVRSQHGIGVLSPSSLSTQRSSGTTATQRSSGTTFQVKALRPEGPADRRGRDPRHRVGVLSPSRL